MKYLVWVALLLIELVIVSLLWAGNTHAPTGDVATEQRAWWGDALTTGYVIPAPAGLCQHTTSGSTSATLSPCRAYVLNTGTPRQLEYIEDLGLRTVNYSAGPGTYWLIVHASINEVVSGWQRVSGTHYLWRQSASQPSLPNRAGWLLSATVSSTAITAVTDRRTVGSPITSTFLGLTDVPDTYAGQAGRVVRVNPGETALEFGTVTGTDDQTAAEVPFSPTPAISATNVQAAIEEVRAEAGTSTATGTLTTIEVQDAIVASNVVRLDFLGVDFDCLESPPGEVNCSIDIGITRDSELSAHHNTKLDVHGIANTTALLTTSHIGQSVQAFDSDLTDISTNQYPAIRIPFQPTGSISAGNVQAAIEEVVFESTGTMRTIKVGNAQLGGSSITTLDFLADDFDCFETPPNEINCTIDVNIARVSQMNSAITTHANVTQQVHGIANAANLLTTSSIGQSVQAFDSDLTDISTNQYPALRIPFTATGTISATNVQAAIEEVAAEAGTSEATGTLNTIQVEDTNVSTGAMVLDLEGDDFDCTESPPGEVNCTIDIGITRDSELSAHTGLTQSVHGIANTANLLTTSSIGQSVQAFDSDLTDISTNQYPAFKIPFTPAGTIDATNVQDAIVEAAAEGGGPGGTGTLTTIKENDVQIGGATIVALDFFGPDFDCFQGPTNEINCAIAPELARMTQVTSAISTHAGVTQNVHGIANAANLLTTSHIGQSVQAFDSDLSEIANNTYPASKILFQAGGTIVATQVQAAIEEVAAEALPLGGGTLTGPLTTSTLGLGFTPAASAPACSEGTYRVFADGIEGTLMLCNNGTLTPIGQTSVTLKAVRVNGHIDDTATSTAVAPEWGGTTSRCRIYEHPTLGATVECFEVSTGTVLTFDDIIYNTDPKRVILHNAGNRDVCMTLDDTGLQTYSAIENCGRFAGAVTFTGAVTTSATLNSTGPVDFGGAPSVKVPTGTTPTTAAAGQLAMDTDRWAVNRGALQLYDGTANTYAVATQATSTPTAGQVPTYNTGGTVTWQTPAPPAATTDTVSLFFACQHNGVNNNPQALRSITDGGSLTCGSSSPNTTIAFVHSAPFSGILAGMACRVETAPGAGQSITMTAFVEGVPTNTSCTITGASATACTDTVGNTTPVTAGNTIGVDQDSTVSSPSWRISCDVLVQKS